MHEKHCIVIPVWNLLSLFQSGGSAPIPSCLTPWSSSTTVFIIYSTLFISKHFFSKLAENVLIIPTFSKSMISSEAPNTTFHPKRASSLCDCDLALNLKFLSVTSLSLMFVPFLLLKVSLFLCVYSGVLPKVQGSRAQQTTENGIFDTPVSRNHCRSLHWACPTGFLLCILLVSAS